MGQESEGWWCCHRTGDDLADEEMVVQGNPKTGEIEMKCQICGKGKVFETEEKNHKTIVLGQELTIPEAIVGRCDTCGSVNYALRKEVVEGGYHE